MSIIIRKNKHTARIMRQLYVRKGVEGNEYGFVRQVPLATISLSATDMPADVAELLTSKEREHLERKVIAPARLAAERLRKQEEAKERDPGWRVSAAIEFLEDAAVRARQISVDKGVLAKLHQVVGQLGPAATSNKDPLDTATAAVKQAIQAVEEGVYGSNDGTVRKDTLPAMKWAELRAVLLEDKRSLLAVLQEAGWVVKRERSVRS